MCAFECIAQTSDPGKGAPSKGALLKEDSLKGGSARLLHSIRSAAPALQPTVHGSHLWLPSVVAICVRIHACWSMWGLIYVRLRPYGILPHYRLSRADSARYFHHHPNRFALQVFFCYVFFCARLRHRGLFGFRSSALGPSTLSHHRRFLQQLSLACFFTPGRSRPGPVHSV